MTSLFREVPTPAYGHCVAYFVQAATGQVKIGRSKRLADRLEALRACSPVKLRLVGWAPERGWLENQLHFTFGRHRLHGEWFRPHPRMKRLLDELRTLTSGAERLRVARSYVSSIHRVSTSFFPSHVPPTLQRESDNHACARATPPKPCSPSSTLGSAET